MCMFELLRIYGKSLQEENVKKGNHKSIVIMIIICLLSVLAMMVIIVGSSNQVTKEKVADSYIMPETSGMDMGELYETAKKCVVCISMKQSVGSGIIWEISEDGIIIVSSKHLLLEDVEGVVTFWNGQELRAEITAYSQQHDIGYLKISEENIPEELKQEIYTVRHPLNTKISEDEILWTVGEPVLQIGYLQKEEVHFEGEVKDKQFMPEFNEDMLQTLCYAKAGMSGGAVFDRYGNLLGMISGGAVEEEAKEREADITYSIPVEVLEEEYEQCK